MSHSVAILRKRSRPRGLERSSVTHSTLRRSCIQLVATPGPPSRAGSWMPSVRHPTSPAPGRSTWITSAPISAHIAAAKGWAISVPVETTRTPWSGPNGSGTRDFPAILIFYLYENLWPDDALFDAERATSVRRPGATHHPRPSAMVLTNRNGVNSPVVSIETVLPSGQY